MSYIEVPDLFFRFNPHDGKEKITLGPIDNQKHLTIHFGTKSGILDIHIKNEDDGKYETIFQIDHSLIVQIAEKIGSSIDSDIKKEFSRYINVGRLNRYNCVLQTFSENLVETFFKRNEAKTKFKLRKDISVSDFENTFFWPEDAIALNDHDYFIVHRIRNGFLVTNGVVIKIKGRKASRKFIYINLTKIQSRLQKVLQPIFSEISPIQKTGLDTFLKILEF